MYGGHGVRGEVAGRVKMRHFLKQDNCGCIINNQLKFDI